MLYEIVKELLKLLGYGNHTVGVCIAAVSLNADKLGRTSAAVLGAVGALVGARPSKLAVGITLIVGVTGTARGAIVGTAVDLSIGGKSCVALDKVLVVDAVTGKTRVLRFEIVCGRVNVFDARYRFIKES